MILFVDDQNILTENLRTTLRDLGGYDVKYANGINQAKEILKTESKKVQLVLLDIMMPTEDDPDSENDRYGYSTGLRLGKWIKDTYPKIPIWAITVRDDIKHEEKLEAGIIKLYKRPVNIQELLTDINNKLGEK